MALKVTGWVTFWESRPGKGNYLDVRISSSKKDASGKYTTDYSSWARFAGKAKEKVEALSEKDRIHITEAIMTNQFSKEKNITYYNLTVFDFDKSDSASTKSKETPQTDVKQDVDDNEPW